MLTTSNLYQHIQKNKHIKISFIFQVKERSYYENLNMYTIRINKESLHNQGVKMILYRFRAEGINVTFKKNREVKNIILQGILKNTRVKILFDRVDG